MQNRFDKRRFRKAVRVVRSATERLEPRRLMANVVVNTVSNAVVADSFTSLREAVAIANTATSATNIAFDATVFSVPRTIQLGGTQLRLSNTSAATTIEGPAAGLTLDAQKLSRHFFINNAVTATLSRLTFTNGAALGTTFTVANPTDRGGAIENQGLLTVRHSTFFNNSATSFGGALNQDANGAVTLTNVTITGNSIKATNGAGGGMSVFGAVNLNNVTIAGNTAAAGAGITVNNNSGKPFSVANSIIAANATTLAGAGDALGTFASKGNNIIGKTNQSAGWIASDQKGTIAAPLLPKLAALASNGGPTQTMLPLAGSPAINHGSNALVSAGITTDQRGLTRIVGPAVDVGAVEIQPAAAPEVEVRGNNVVINDNDATAGASDFTDFGTVGVGSPLTRTFTVKNTGTAALTTGGLTVPAGFTITEGLSGSIAAGGSDTFSVRLNATAAGTFAGNISFTNNDANESPYNFAIKGVVNVPTFRLVSGVLTVTGTSGNDLIRGSIAGNVLTMKVNSLSQTFNNASSIARITVNALAGNDQILLAQSVNRPTSLNGGDGNDIIYGGSGTDAINGGNGTDLAFRNGSDTVSLVEEILG